MLVASSFLTMTILHDMSVGIATFRDNLINKCKYLLPMAEAKQFCADVLSVDDSIRFAGVADSTGTSMHFVYRKGLVPLLSPEETAQVHAPSRSQKRHAHHA